MSLSLPSLEIVRPALLLGPQSGIVLGGVGFELGCVRADNLLAAVLALDFAAAISPAARFSRLLYFSGSRVATKAQKYMRVLTIDVAFGGLTGRPLALTGVRVPAEPSGTTWL